MYLPGRFAAVGAAALVTVLALPGVASAATVPLPDGQEIPVLVEGADPAQCAARCIVGSPTVDFGFSTERAYWSVVVVNPAGQLDYDLTLLDSAGRELNSSTFGDGVPDFVAIDSNLRPLGGYTARVDRFHGDEDYLQYVIQLGQGDTVLPPQAPGSRWVQVTGRSATSRYGTSSCAGARPRPCRSPA